MTAALDGEFACSLWDGINRPLKIHKWLPVAMAMPRMLRELERQKELGLLGSDLWFGRTTISLQYWRYLDHLMNYASNQNHEHLPAWKAFTRAVGGSGDVGIWHETYTVRPGSYQNIYHNMPPFDLAAWVHLSPRPATSNPRSSARYCQALAD